MGTQKLGLGGIVSPKRILLGRMGFPELGVGGMGLLDDGRALTSHPPQSWESGENEGWRVHLSDHLKQGWSVNPSHPSPVEST